ncbi:MAG: hypothetical protein HYY23_17990 [Verrucomicrobia bacterium]|nr:hypothetical protein [Verrucomicrobiota bacterium]
MTTRSSSRYLLLDSCLCAALIAIPTAHSAPAVLLFEDDFNRGIPGWTAVQPTGNGTYISEPLRWQYDIVGGGFLEQSNIYTDAADASPSATAPMLINDAVAGTNFTYKARLTAGDDDAFGLIFGYQNANNFFRVTFTRQRRTVPGYPWNGWNVDRRVNNVSTNLFGHGTPDHVESFFNTQYQPFDVTIAVTGNNLFSLTVLDDPEGAKTEYKLVEAKPLPRAANGRVGLIVWGMSGTALRGFRIHNPVLDPVKLVGNPNALTNWTAVVPPRADGSGLDPASGNSGQPIWSLALGQNGAFGTLHENSDANGGNDDAGVVDFAAASIVAGDVTWSNYVMTTRIIPADDDGHGILLRYKDEKNFYRVALRSQDSATGPRQGLSVQKVINGVFEEIFHDDPVKYAPPANVPYDITAVMVGNRLQLQVVGNPTGAAQSFAYGPFDITGATVPNGKIGFFSWGMSRTEFDFVRVHGIDGLPLQVNSAYGAPNPGTGLQGFASGSSVAASVASPVEESPGLRRVISGWTGSGSVPASGTGSSVTFTLNDVSSLTWIWRTEIKLAVTAGAGGQVTAPTGDWLAEGTNVVVTAQANPGFVFAGWSGDLASAERTLSLQLNRPFTITARFEADSDNDGIPDKWEQSYFGGLTAAADGDPDKDGKTNLAEYQRGTDPNSAETLVASDGLSSRWENVQRDPALPGQWAIRDFGRGFKGAWENSNDFRNGNDTNFLGAGFFVDNASFEGPRLIIRTNVWNPAWNNFTAQTVFSVGDNDGNCVYFRYKDENNWYRVTILGEANNDVPPRPVYGVSIQKRVNGQFADLGRDATIATDPPDTAGYKRVRITVNAQGSNFEVRVAGWDAKATPPNWLAASEVVMRFTDDQLPIGRFGVGDWGQSGGSLTPENPVNAGVLIESVVITVGGNEVFREDWSQFPLWQAAPLLPLLPPGWTRPVTGTPAGNWQVSADGSIMELSNYNTATTGTVNQPKANGESTILLAPPPGVPNYFLELGFHPFDDDGLGFIYDFQDTNNYSRVLFVSEATGNTRVPQGVSVSRKSAGAWSDIIVGDNTFVFRNGSPFTVEFANNNGEFRMSARNVDDPAAVRTWSWTGAAAGATNRFGLTAWGMSDAHFLYARSYGLPARGTVSGDLRISKVSIAGGNVVLDVSNPGGAAYAVETSSTLASGSWNVLARDQTGAQWTTPLPAGAGAAFYRLSRGR